MSDEMDTKLRELAYRLIEMAPGAPPFPEETMVKLDTRPAPASTWRRSPLVWVAATAVAALVVVGVPLLLLGGGTDSPPATEGPTPSVTSPVTTVPVEPVATTLEFSVYLFSDDIATAIGDPALVPVHRSQSYAGSVDDALGESLNDAIGSLVVDPVPAGYSSAIPAGIDTVTTGIEGGIATVDLPAAFESGGGSASMFGRLAQVVLTATQFDGVDSVLFEIDGVPVDVFSGEGIILDGPQTRADYYDDAQAIYAATPANGSAVTSPITISGAANVFEATLAYEVTTVDGATLAEGFTTATCGTGCWGDFAVDVPYTLAEDTEGQVTVFTNSAEDGSRVNVFAYPVLLTAPQSGAAAACSGAEVDAAVVEQADLPEAVAATRAAIYAAAHACDWAALQALADAGDDPFQATLGGGDVDLLRQDESRGIPVLADIMAHLNLAYRLPIDGVSGYMWPSAVDLTGPDGEGIPADEYAALLEVYTVDDLEAMFEGLGSYVGMRVGIDETGEWLFVVTGD
jgi:hypothetical protein